MQTHNTFNAGSKYGSHQKFRHVYWCQSSLTPYHFRFSVGSDVFRDPSAFGRPVGVFNADCYGITPQDASDERTKVKISEDPNTARRFPCATAFTTREAAAIEGDFWKLVLRRQYYLEIPWSHATYEDFIYAAEQAQRDPVAELDDETKWSHELLDFIDQHQSQLLAHRDAHKPEVDLDQWMKIAKATNNHKLRTWVEQVRSAQDDLESFYASMSGKTEAQLARLSKKLDVDNVQVPTKNYVFGARVSGLNKNVRATKAECDLLLSDIIATRTGLTNNLSKLLNERPPML